MSCFVDGRIYSAEPSPGQCLRTLSARIGNIRGQKGVRRRRLRGLYGMARRRPGTFLPAAGISRRMPPDHDDRRVGEGRPAAPDAAGLSRRPGFPVRLLHRRHDHDRRRPERRAAAGLTAQSQGQSVPLHRLSRHRRRSRRAGAHRGRCRRRGLRRQPAQPVRSVRSSPERPGIRWMSRSTVKRHANGTPDRHLIGTPLGVGSGLSR